MCRVSEYLNLRVGGLQIHDSLLPPVLHTAAVVAVDAIKLCRGGGGPQRRGAALVSCFAVVGMTWPIYPIDFEFLS